MSGESSSQREYSGRNGGKECPKKMSNTRVHIEASV